MIDTLSHDEYKVSLGSEDNTIIKDLKDLQSLLKLCRKQGVTAIDFDGVRVSFGEMPAKSSDPVEPEDPPTEELTPDQLMFFSVGGQQP